MTIVSGSGGVPQTTQNASSQDVMGAKQANPVETQAAGNLQGVTPPQISGASSAPVKSKAPELALPIVDFGDEEMVTALMGFLNGKAQNSTLKGLMESVSQNQDKMATQNKDRLKQIQSAAENSQKAENKGFWSKLWGIVAKVATIVASVAAIVVTGGAAAPFVIALAAYSIVSTAFSLVNDIVKMAGGKGVDWDLSLGEAAKQIALATGTDEETANKWKMGVDIGMAALTAVVSLASLAKGLVNVVKSGIQSLTKAGGAAAKTASKTAETATDVAASAAKVTEKTAKVVGQVVQGVSGITGAGATVTSGVFTLQKGEFQKLSSQAQANAKEILALVAKLQKMFDADSELMQKVMEEQVAAEQFISELFAGIQRTRSQTVNLMA
jgi:hypothetical protein